MAGCFFVPGLTADFREAAQTFHCSETCQRVEKQYERQGTQEQAQYVENRIGAVTVNHRIHAEADKTTCSAEEDFLPSRLTCHKADDQSQDRAENEPYSEQRQDALRPPVQSGFAFGNTAPSGRE